MLRDIKPVGDRVPVPPTMAQRSTAPEASGDPERSRSARWGATPGGGRYATSSPSDAPEPSQAPAGAGRVAPTTTRRIQRWIEMGSLAACLVAGAAGWWLYRSEVDNRAEMPTAPRAGDDLAQVKQALQQERDRPKKTVRELAMAQRGSVPSAATPSNGGDKAAENLQVTDLRQALQQAEWLWTTYQDLLTQERARNQDLEQQLAEREDDQQLLTQERARNEELQRQLDERRDDQKQLAQERAHTQELEQQLEERHSDQQLLSEERARSQQLEQRLEESRRDQQLLSEERARNQQLEQQLAAYQSGTPGRDRNAMPTASDTSDPTQPPAIHQSATATPPKSDQPATSASDKPATTPAPTTPQTPGNLEPARLMARASLLLAQGNISAARIVLERAAETGSASALFALAETYDPAVLSAWGTLGTQGDVAKAQELYARAAGGGVEEAKDRLNALR